jgi:hypothetical protein
VEVERGGYRPLKWKVWCYWTESELCGVISALGWLNGGLLRWKTAIRCHVVGKR